MRLSDAIDGFLFHKSIDCSSHTLSDYRNTLAKWRRYLETDKHVDELRPHDIQGFLYYLRVEQELRPKTVMNALTGISSFFTWAEIELEVPHLVREGKIKLRPVNPPEIVPLSRQDLKALLQACNRDSTYLQRGTIAEPARPTKLRDRAIVLMLLDTGLRAQELCDLMVGDVNRQTGMVMIRHGKGDKERVVYLGKIAQEALWRYMAKREFKRPDDPLFMTAKRGPMDRHMLRKMLKRAGERAGLTEPVYPHRMRHTFAISYLRNGGDIYTLQKLLGHSSLDMVKRYLAIASVDLEQSHRRASPVDNWRL